MRLLRPFFLLLLLATGCSMAPTASTNGHGTPPPTPVANTATLQGRVHGGQSQQPIQGAQIYMLAVGTGPSGTQSVSRMNATANTSNVKSINSNWYYVTTRANGNFSIGAGDYTCVTGDEIYLYSVGGNPGLTPSTINNTAATLMAVLGKCTAPGTFQNLPTTGVQLDEVTTVGAAYALAGFATDPTHIAAPSSASQALANAILTVGNVANLGTGLPPATSTGGNGAVPQTEINTLADILAACVNEPDPATGGCPAVLPLALSGGTTGTQPGDTATAAINIAHNPWANMTPLFNQASTTAPYQPELSGAPNDWTIAITYTGGGLNEPYGVAVDSAGNLWTSNQGGSSISEFGPTGAPAASSPFSGGLNGPRDIAIDTSNNVWVANFGNSTVSEYNGSSFSNPSGGSLNGPSGIAVDPSTDVWVSNNSNSSVTEFVGGAGTAHATGGADSPLGVAIDAFSNAWVADNAGSRISEYNSSGGNISGAAGFTGGSLNGATGIAIDASNNVWVTNQTGNSLSEFNQAGTALHNYTGGGLNGPRGVAVDGAGNVWIANNGAGAGSNISEFSTSLGAFVVTTAGGYEAELPNALHGPNGIAVDGSGNVWVTNNASGANTLTEFVGAAAPVTATPLVERPFNLTIGTTSLPNGAEGTAYSATLTAGGGTKPYTWSQTGGSALSTWNLSLNASTGVISGTPNATVSAVPLTFTVTDSSGAPQQQSVTLDLTITTGTGMTVAVSPRNSGITTSQTLSLTATTSDPNGVNWSATGGVFSSGNTQTGVAVTYTPAATAGAYVITATSASESSVSASVNVGVTNLTGVFTYHNDNSRDGANLQEYALTSTNVAKGTFGKLFSCTVDSPIYTQPLWVPNMTINAAQHNVVFVATTNDSLYAFDADSTTSPCTPLWQANLLDSAHGGTAGEAPVPAGITGALVGQKPPAGDIEPTVGVIGTPVIDSSTGTLYVVSKSYVSGTPNTFFQRLHAIDLTNGSEKFSGPANITGTITFPCSGTGCTKPAFIPQTENQRCALALGNDGTNNIVYVSWASHEDAGDYHGWLVGFNAGTLAPEYVFNDTPDGAQGGIWMSGGAPAIDGSGNLYLLTGNGTFDANATSVPHDDYGDSLVELTPQLAVTQYFAPQYAPDDEPNGHDNDFGSGGALVLVNVPGGGGSLPTSLVIGGGKGGQTSGTPGSLVGNPGYFYVLNASQLGGYGTPWQQVDMGNGESIFSTGAFWSNANVAENTAGTYFIGAQFASVLSYTLSTSSVTLLAGSATSNKISFPGTTPSISSTPAYTNGIVWAQDNSNYCTKGAPGCKAAVLYAYNASTLTALWNSTQGTGLGGISNAAGHAMKFTIPTVANGKVYVSTRGTGTATDKTTGELDVYGLLP